MPTFTSPSSVKSNNGSNNTNFRNRLSKLPSSVSSLGLSTKELLELRFVFDSMDVTKVGKLSLDTFKVTLRGLGYEVTREEVCRVVQSSALFLQQQQQQQHQVGDDDLSQKMYSNMNNKRRKKNNEGRETTPLKEDRNKIESNPSANIKLAMTREECIGTISEEEDDDNDNDNINDESEPEMEQIVDFSMFCTIVATTVSLHVHGKDWIRYIMWKKRGLFTGIIYIIKSFRY